jgi:hypothetical protein
MSRAYTKKEVREHVLQHIRNLVDYWAAPDIRERDVHGRLSGLAFSILNIFDGTTAELPSFDIVCKPHPDDESYCKSEGANWYEDGTVINDDVLLHEMFYKKT